MRLCPAETECFNSGYLESRQKALRKKGYPPSLHFGEVNSYQSVGKGFLVQISAVPPDELGHVITLGRKKGGIEGCIIIEFMYNTLETEDVSYLAMHLYRGNC